MLHVDVNRLPKTITYKEKLQLKNEFHVNLINLEDLATRLGKEASESIASLFGQHIDVIDYKNTKLTNEFRYTEDERERKTIIAMVHIPGLVRVYDQIQNEVGLTFDYYPTHITLYTFGKNRGIWINNEEMLASMTEKIEDQEVLRLLENIEVSTSYEN